MKWVTEDEVDQLSFEYSVGFTDCIEVLPDGNEILLFYNEKFLCDETGRILEFNKDLSQELYPFTEDDFTPDKTRVIFLNGSYHLLLGPAFILRDNGFGKMLNFSPKQIVKYEQMFNKYLGVKSNGANGANM